jgi:hypothetical protein
MAPLGVGEEKTVFPPKRSPRKLLTSDVREEMIRDSATSRWRTRQGLIVAGVVIAVYSHSGYCPVPLHYIPTFCTVQLQHSYPLNLRRNFLQRVNSKDDNHQPVNGLHHSVHFLCIL